MNGVFGRTIRAALVVPALSVALGGCIYASTEKVERDKAAASPVIVTAAQSDRIIAYPGGRWQLFGDGQSTPYYWVWIPSGATPPPPPPPPLAP